MIKNQLFFTQAVIFKSMIRKICIILLTLITPDFVLPTGIFVVSYNLFTGEILRYYCEYCKRKPYPLSHCTSWS